MIGCIGDDAFGARLHDALSAEGIDVRHLARIGGTATGVATITVDEGGANSIVVVPARMRASMRTGSTRRVTRSPGRRCS